MVMDLTMFVASASGSRSEEGEKQAMKLGRNDYSAQQSF